MSWVARHAFASPLTDARVMEKSSATQCLISETDISGKSSPKAFVGVALRGPQPLKLWRSAVSYPPGGVADQFAGGAQVELLAHMATVGIHCLHGQVQALGDFAGAD